MTPFAPLPSVRGGLELAFSADGRTLAYVAACPAPTRGRDCLSVMNIPTRQITRRWLVPPSWDVENLSLSAGGGRLVFGFSPPRGRTPPR